MSAEDELFDKLRRPDWESISDQVSEEWATANVVNGYPSGISWDIIVARIIMSYHWDPVKFYLILYDFISPSGIESYPGSLTYAELYSTRITDIKLAVNCLRANSYD